MAVIKLLGFGGMIPVTDDRLLPDTNAALSQNCYLYTGQLVGIVSPKYIRDLTNPTYGKAYRIPNNYFDAEHIEDAVWMEFNNIDTDIVRSPIVDDQYDRYYWARPDGPPQVNSLARIRAGQPPYQLGVISPTAAPIISSIIGGVGLVESRAYITTWVSAFAEESAPYLPVLGSGKSDATWNLTLPAALAGDITNYNLSKTRIYRTISSGGATEYFFVAEIPIGTLTFADNIPSTTVSANEINISVNWSPPPDDLVGIISMPNGMIAGWRGSELWFCEPYRPHAWPVAYNVSVEYPIIGLGVTNQTLAVCTAGYPMVATGIHPDSISMSKLASFEPCMSRGSILSVPEGVLFASPNGLVLIANGQAQLITDGLIQRDEWNNYNRIATLRATRMSNAYYAFGSERKGFMQTDTFQTNAFQQDDFFGSFRGILLDPTNQRISFNLLTSDLITTNIFNDAWSGETLIIRSGKIYRLDMADREFARDVALWKSKIFQATDKKNFAAMRVYFEIPPWATSFVDSYTKLLLHFDGAGGATSFIDECGHTFTAAGNAQIDTADSKIGGASLLLDGVGDWVTTADTDDWAIGANDFTIECWFKCNAAGGTQLMIAGQCDSAATVTSRSFNIYRETTNVMAAGVFVGTTAYNCSGTIQFTNAVNTGWHHIALVRIGNVLKMFIDGAQDGGDVAITGTVNNSPNALRIGALGEYVSQPWIGWIDEFRFSIGKARWTTNFTPSTAPYTLVVPLNPVRNTSENQTLQSDQYGIVRVYADNRLVMTRELRTSGELMRLPAGFKADYWQIEFETRVRINSVQLATSVKELLKA